MRSRAPRVRARARARVRGRVLNGKSLKVEVPGSCKPPDYEVCTEVAIKPEQCSTFDVKVERTSTTVNDIVLLDGHAKVECAFPEGGTAKADFRFESCN